MIPPPFELADPRANHPDQSLVAELGALTLEILKYFRDAMPVFLQLIVQPSFNLAGLADREPRMPLHRLGEAVATCLERHRQRGTINADVDQIRAASFTLLATLHSLAFFERIGVHGGAFPEAVVKNIVGLIVAGLTAQNGERSR